MNHDATKQEKRAKPHKRKTRVLLAISLLIIFISTTVLQSVSEYASVTWEPGNVKGANLIVTGDAKWKEELSSLSLKGDSSSEDVLVIAQSQLGYEQSLETSNIDESNKETKYYNRYGAEYNRPYDEWNTAFMVFCLQYAKVSEEVFPTDLDCLNWRMKLQNKGLYFERNQQEAKIGNLVFFDKDNDTSKPYVGIIESIDKTKDKETFTAIVGDYDGKVQKIVLKSTQITGYGVIPPAITPTEPSIEPSAEPSIEPSVEPSKEPDVTPKPTAKVKERDSVTSTKEGIIALAAVPNLLSTVDSRADGIKLNLFNYFGEGLDNNNNTVENPVIQGINKDTNNQKREFLFLGRGSTGTRSRDEMINVYTGSSMARQGIILNKLDGGYPKLNTTKHSSLDYLFDPTVQVSGKTTFADVNHLFKKDAEGYYVYDSNENYAYYDSNAGGGDFKVYADTYKIANSTDSIGFFPFNSYDSSKNSISPGSGYDHHFGLSMEFNFLLTEDGTINNKDMVFEFSGDDDVWVFIDDVLVLDLGGIHREVGGKINFAKDLVTVESSTGLTNSSGSWTSKSITQLFTEAGRIYNKDPLSQHTLKFFYLERGSNYSNNMIKFNLPTGLHISKEISGEHAADYANQTFAFKLMVQRGITGSAANYYDPYTGEKAYYDNKINDASKVNFNNGVFTMKAGQTVDIYGISPNKKYYLQEVNINENIFPDVKINSVVASKVYPSPRDGTYIVESSKDNIFNRSAISFQNILKEEYKDINLLKQWQSSDGSAKTENLPSEIQVELWKKEMKTGAETLEQTITLNSANKWTQVVKHLPITIGDRSYTYFAKEISVPGYTSTITQPQSSNNYTVTVCNVEKAFEIKVDKRWFKPDGSDKTDGLPEKVAITLKRSITKSSTVPTDSTPIAQVELTKEKAWSHTFKDTDTGIEAYDPLGNPYYYYVVEGTLSDYRTTYDNNGVSIDSQSKTITVNNTSKFVENITIPIAGGSGVAAFTLVGTTLIGLSLLLLIYLYRGRRRCK